MFANDGQTLKISDFGLATVFKQTNIRDGIGIPNQSHTAEVGTFSYMAPELQDGQKQYNHKIDIYSLGLIALEMFKSYQTKMEKIEAFNEARNGNVPQFEERENVKKMLKLEPNERPEASDILKS